MPTTTTTVAIRALQGGAKFSGGTMKICEAATVKNDTCKSDSIVGETMENQVTLQTLSKVKKRFGVKTETVSSTLHTSKSASTAEEDSKRKQLSTTNKGHPVSFRDDIKIKVEEDCKTSLLDILTAAATTTTEESPQFSTQMMKNSNPGNHDATGVERTPHQISSLTAVGSNSLEPKVLFQYLVNYLEVTPEQANGLKDSRQVAQDLDTALAKSLAMLQELRGRLTQCGKDLDEEFSIIQSILSPRQAAKFLVWVANNQACMHMLNELWSKVYPEPIITPITREDFNCSGIHTKKL